MNKAQSSDSHNKKITHPRLGFRPLDYSSLVVGEHVQAGRGKDVYTIMARTQRFIICTCKERQTYFICDLIRGIRNHDNYIFSPHDYLTNEGCDKALKELAYNKMEISIRGARPLDLKRVETTEETR